MKVGMGARGEVSREERGEQGSRPWVSHTGKSRKSTPGAHRTPGRVDAVEGGEENNRGGGGGVLAFFRTSGGEMMGEL